VGTSPLQKQIGLDELSFSSGDTGSTGGVVTLGKRISERIYVMVERGLTTASNAVKVNYQLSRRWSLRTESGRTDAVDIFYSFSWD
jgi:translocation and assembly module TamB